MPTIATETTQERDRSEPAKPAAPSIQNPIANGGGLITGLLLALGTIVVYQPILHNGFTNFDDPYYLTENTSVRQGFTWSSLRWAFTTMDNSNWHPLTWLVHTANVQIFGMNPMGHHLASVLWHTLNVVLVFVLLKRMTAETARSAVVAALFAVCPLNVEPVAWAAELKTLVSTTFLLLAFLAYRWYTERRTIGRYAATLSLFTAGLLAKGIIMVFPFLLLLADYWPLKRMRMSDTTGDAREMRTFGELIVEKIPFFIISAISSVVTLHAAGIGGTLATVQVRPVGLRIENAVWSYSRYVWKMIWPAHLAILYPFPERLLPIWKVGVGACVLVGFSLIAWRYREKKKYLLVGWCWFLGSLVPVSGIAQAGPQGMADRYAYTSFIGLFIAAVWLASEWIGANRARIMLGTIVAIGSVIGYAVVARAQMGYWHDSYAVFSHALEVEPDNPVAENDLGSALTKMGRDDLALAHFQNAARLLPTYSTAHYNQGILLQKQNKLDQAFSEYNMALICSPSRQEEAQIHNNEAVIMLQLGRGDDALSQYNAALKSFPLLVESLVGRASIEYQRHQLSEAQTDLWKGFILTHSPRICLLLGRVLEDEGNLKGAEQAFQTALQLSPGLQEAESRLNAVRSKLQK